jgi:hypothetical protein
VAEDFDKSYFSDEQAAVEAAKPRTNQLAVGIKCLNDEELTLIAELGGVIQNHGLVKIEFSIVDDDTGVKTIIEPGRTPIEEEMYQLILRTYKPLIQAARAKGRNTK